MAIGDLLLFISTKSARVSDSAWQASTSNISALAAMVTLVASRASGDKVGAVISFPRRGTTTTSVRRTRRIIVALHTSVMEFIRARGGVRDLSWSG